MMHGYPMVCSLWMFGSRARGNFRDDSDCDLAVSLFETDDASPKWRVYMSFSTRLKADLSALIPWSIDLQFWDDTAPLIATAVCNDGIELFQAVQKSPFEKATVRLTHGE
jgi:predicted nucleotidyltransferase